MLVGHDDARRQLEERLPPVTLVSGPPHIGKTTLVYHVLKHHKIIPADTLHPKKLSADEARNVHSFLATRPLGPAKAVVADLDKADDRALNILLKILEEPPPQVHFLLTTTAPTLLTVQSRSYLVRLGLLSTDQIKTVLQAKFRMSPDEAARCAVCSGGRMDKALEAVNIDQLKAPVLSLLKGAAEGNEDLFSAALSKWGNDQHNLLKVWATENRTRIYRVFTPIDGFGLQDEPKSIEHILKALRLGARPKIAAKLALGSVLDAHR